MDVEEGYSLEDLSKKGWLAPERFAAPGRDGETINYGIIIRPSKFNQANSYPVPEEIYAGPQTFFTPKSFSSLPRLRRWAKRDYVVVQLAIQKVS
jgi:dipeptidyl-peptidase 4